MPDQEKEAKGQAQEKKEERPEVAKAEHRKWIRRELDEARQEKKKAFGFQRKFKKGVDLRQKAMFGGKFIHGTMGKPTHGPRGNQG